MGILNLTVIFLDRVRSGGVTELSNLEMEQRHERHERNETLNLTSPSTSPLLVSALERSLITTVGADLLAQQGPGEPHVPRPSGAEAQAQAPTPDHPPSRASPWISPPPSPPPPEPKAVLCSLLVPSWFPPRPRNLRKVNLVRKLSGLPPSSLV